jgi:predicted Zn-dependent protease
MDREHRWKYLASLGIGLTLALYACAKSNQSRVGSDLKGEDAKFLDEYRAEVEIGRNMAGRMLGYYGVIEDDKVIGYVNQVGNYVASYSDYPERRYMFAILKHESINAFACPGGYILITMGALRMARNEAELAAILGHEVAHVGKRHMFDTLKKMKKDELEKKAKESAQVSAKDKALRMRERPKGEESGTGAVLARYLLGSGGTGLNILQAAQAGMNVMTEKGLDQDLEFEADQEGVKYAIRAGYEPKAMLKYLARAEASSDKKLKNLEKTHPTMAQRKKSIQKLLKKLKAEDIIGADGIDRFEKARKLFPKAEKD